MVDDSPSAARSADGLDGLDRWLTVKQAAEYAQVSVRTLQRARARGDLVCGFVGAGRRPAVRVKVSAIDSWLYGEGVGDGQARGQKDERSGDQAAQGRPLSPASFTCGERRARRA